MNEQKQNLKELGIDGTWTLFLDRDGVINRRIKGDYVRNWSQFIFLRSSREAIRRLSEIFGRIIVVTNQRGISKHLIEEADMSDIHRKMADAITKSGGRIDRVYVCRHGVLDLCSCRKPRPGLALEAQKDFPSIEFSKSVMVGDDDTDVKFALALCMKSVLLIGDESHRTGKVTADFVFKDLLEFSLSL